MTIVDDRAVRQCRQILERGGHLGGGALEETTAAGDEERVAREDAAWVRAVRGRDVVAYRVLRVAGSV